MNTVKQAVATTLKLGFTLTTKGNNVKPANPKPIQNAASQTLKSRVLSNCGPVQKQGKMKSWEPYLWERYWQLSPPWLRPFCDSARRPRPPTTWIWLPLYLMCLFVCVCQNLYFCVEWKWRMECEGFKEMQMKRFLHEGKEKIAIESPSTKPTTRKDDTERRRPTTPHTMPGLPLYASSYPHYIATTEFSVTVNIVFLPPETGSPHALKN